MNTTTTEMKIGMTFPARIAILDTETTSPDPQEARIVTCFIGVLNTQTLEIEERWEWVVNPGVEIPKGASDIHGYTTERVLVEGGDPKQAIFDIVQRIDILNKRSLALVIMNAVYDMTVIDRELERHWGPAMRPPVEGKWEAQNTDGKWIEVYPGGPSFADWKRDVHPTARWTITSSPVIFDPMVFDRAIDQYRAGKRTLVDLAKHYGVPVLENAHDAEADCIMAGGVAIKLLGHSRVADLSLSEVHDKLIPTKRKQAHGLWTYWRDKKMRTLKTEAERAELKASILNVQTYGHYWPVIPRGV